MELGIFLVVFNTPTMTFSDVFYVLLFHAHLKINYRIEATRFDVILGCNIKSKALRSIGLFIRRRIAFFFFHKTIL
jgi:hypothetical protein